jgi:predicted CXXCH cytochrome family protein
MGSRWSLIAACLLVGALFGVDNAEARSIAAKRECSICHIMWLDDFQRNDVTTLIPFDPKPVMNTGKQDVVSNERNCFSCHDGFILDSRFVWEEKRYSHPVGVEPSKKVSMPTADEAMLRPEDNLFPLNDDGKVYCGTCHSAHGVDWKQKESPVFLRAKNIESSICLNCHRNRSTGPKGGNHPIRKKLDQIPSELVDAGSKFGEDNKVICQSCHRIHGGRDNKVLVASNKNSALCGKCHSDRYAKDKVESTHMGTHPVNIVSDKVKIPQEILDKGGKVGQKGEIICQTCHMPHLAQKKATILVKRNTNSALCQTCHVKERAVKGSKHNIALTDTEDANIRQQKVGKAGVCSACHVPHKGNGPRMWARPLKKGEDSMADLCLSCHSKGSIAEHKLVGEISHPLGRDLALLGNDVGLPGYSKDGIKTVGGQAGRVTCASCHNPHQWDPNDVSATSKPGDSSDASNRFLRVSNAGSKAALCRNCHKDKGNVQGTKHDVATMGKSAVQKGSAPGLCNTCHTVHKGKGPRLWAREPVKGVDPISSICLSCHNPEGLGKKKTTGEHSHPVAAPIAKLGITPTGEGWLVDKSKSNKSKKKGNKYKEIKALPLFDSEGRKTYIDAQVMCASCHDPHNWSVAGLPAKKGSEMLEGDGQSSFLRIANGQKAELCANCHWDKKPVNQSKHNLAITAPTEKNVAGQSAEGVAVCMNCHLPHNGKGPKMWARAFGEGGDKVEAMCRDCHREGGVAEAKLTGENSHPVQAKVGKIGGRTSFPLFDSEGKRIKAKSGGRVSCPSCHDPHQWDPLDASSKAGADAKIEGGANNSFLRLPAAPAGDLCVDCHRDQRWIKGTDHDLRVTAPEGKNAKGQTVSESGVCQQCHSVHNAGQALRLWAREPGEGQDLNERMCRGCHSEGRVAEKKIPVKKNHPPQVEAQIIQRRARRGPVRGFTPLFDEEGKVANSGVISCPTCHNPHRWDALGMDEGPGENVEGSARNSFLRNRSKLALCSNCHGMDALFRYKYFHGETSRKQHQLYR